MTILDLDPIVARRAEVRAIAARSLRRRQTVGVAATVICYGCLAIALVALAAVVGYTVERGVGAWSVAFFRHLPRPEGIPGGGIWNAIVGSAVIDGIAAAGAVPFGICVALFLARSEGPFASAIRFATDVLAGVPSITVGIFAYALLVVTLGHFSAIAASFALGILMLPLVIRAAEVALRAVPKSLVEGALSLGAREATVIRRVVLPGALGGILTGVLLAVARAAGETAPLLFTAIGSQYFATSPMGPMAAMPLVVFLNGIQAYPDLQQIAWGTALLLIVSVFVLNIGSRLFVSRIGKGNR